MSTITCQTASKATSGVQEALFAPEVPEPDPVVMSCPVGPVLETAWGSDGRATATYDPTGAYRFRLSRVWAPGAGRVVFVMLNPSTATAVLVDPTVKRCLRFAREWGYGAVEVANLFALRSTDPKALYAHAAPVGEGNDLAILAACGAADLVVAAWGVHGALTGRAEAVLGLFSSHGIIAHSLKVTKDGAPGHPLYLPSTAVPALLGPQQA